MAFSVEHVRSQFPILARLVHGRPLVYLDNAATTQKPQAALDALLEYYTQHNANVHRGVHVLGDESTQLYYQARTTVAEFFGAVADELILTRNTTESLNLAAQMFADKVGPGDVVAVSLLEHHSNFIPWQRLAQKVGAEFVALPLLSDGRLDEVAFEKLVTGWGKRLKVVALTHISNALGTIMPIERVVRVVRQTNGHETLVVVDAAQSAAHLPIHFDDWDLDALAFSGHKMYGPMGTGGLLVRKALLEVTEPVLWGGGMISNVTVESSAAAAELQDRFAAGTPDVAGVVMLAAACTWMKNIGWENIRAHEEELVEYAYEKLSHLERITLVGPSPRSKDGELQRLGSVAFLYAGAHAHDVAQIVDRYGAAVRSGHHCTMPLHVSAQWIATTRASFAIYNTKEEIDAFVAALQHVAEVFTA